MQRLKLLFLSLIMTAAGLATAQTSELGALKLRTIGPANMNSDRTRPLSGPLVLPGEYTARLIVDGTRAERKFTVIDDRRLSVTVQARRAWTASLTTLAEAYRTATALMEKTKGSADQTPYDTLVAAQARIASVYGNVSASTGVPTADQQAQIAALTKLVGELASKTKLP